MEDWEKEHIKDNLPELLDLTICTASVIAHLISKNVLSKYDSNELSAITTPFDRSKRLYEILSAKTRGYSELHKVLYTERQSGACEILENGFSKQWPIKISKRIEYDESMAIACPFGMAWDKATFYKGKFGGRNVAVKKTDIKSDTFTAVCNEVKLLLMSDANENIIRYLTIERRGISTLMALEQCETTLLTWFSESGKPEITSIKLLHQATLGVAHLHSLKIVHGNLKPENVRLCKIPDNVVRVKIADFRAGKTVNEDDVLGSCRSSLYSSEGIGWMAPEMIEILDSQPENYNAPTCGQNELNAKMTSASDIFSLGCIFYYVMSGGYHPFGSLVRRQGNILRNHRTTDVKMSSKKIPRMIIMDSSLRPDADEILKDESFFQNME